MPAYLASPDTNHAAPETQISITSPQVAASVLRERADAAEAEEFYVLCLDTKHHLVGGATEPLYRGQVGSIHIRLAEVFREACRLNAVAILVAHNHPSGDPTPSPEDCQLTFDLVAAGKLLDIDVLDHVILARGGMFSLKAAGLMPA